MRFSEHFNIREVNETELDSAKDDELISCSRVKRFRKSKLKVRPPKTREVKFAKCKKRDEREATLFQRFQRGIETGFEFIKKRLKLVGEALLTPHFCFSHLI